MVIYEKEKKRIIIPEGIGFVGSDCSKMYDIGFERGFESGYTSGQEDCPECSGGTDCSSAITEAYQSGITEGINTQKSRMESITITANTAVTRTDGWNQITVNVPSSGDCSEAIAEAYQSGHTGGVNEQKAKLDSITITANTTVTREDGWSSVTVNVHSTECNLGPDVESLNSAWDGDSYFYPSSIGKDGFSEMHIYDNGYGSKKIADGRAQQKALLGSTAITENGTYTTNGNGWSSVTVNVASSGDCSEAIAEAYQSGITSQIGEIDTIYVSFIVEDPYNIDEIGIRPFECDGYSFVPTNAIEAVDLPPINRVWYAVKGSFNHKFMTPEVIKVKVYDSVIQRWGNWSVERVGFNGNFIEGSLSAHTAGRYEGGFTYAPISASTEYADETHSWIVIDLGGNTSSCTTAISDALQSGYTVGYSGGYSSGYTDGEAHSLYTEITFTNEQDITFGSGAYAFWIGTDYQNVTELDGDIMVNWDNKTLTAGTHTVKTNISFITDNTELRFQGNYVGYNDGGSFTQTAVTNVVMKLKKTITQ